MEVVLLFQPFVLGVLLNFKLGNLMQPSDSRASTGVATAAI